MKIIAQEVEYMHDRVVKQFSAGFVIFVKCIIMNKIHLTNGRDITCKQGKVSGM